MPLPTGRADSHDLPPKVSQHLRSEMGWNSPATVQLICRAGDPGFPLFVRNSGLSVRRANGFTADVKEDFALTIRRPLSNQLSYPNTFNQRLTGHILKQIQVLDRE